MIIIASSLTINFMHCICYRKKKVGLDVIEFSVRKLLVKLFLYMTTFCNVCFCTFLPCFGGLNLCWSLAACSTVVVIK
jgi:hypothetical protein